MKRPVSFGAAFVLVALLRATAQAQFQPPMPTCEKLAELDTAWQSFATQDINATQADVDRVVQQLGAALEQVAGDARALNPSAFDQLRQAQQAVEQVIDAVPNDATPAQVQDAIADVRERERVFYQAFIDNLNCPPASRVFPLPAQ
jgi:hypothetical protein